MASYTLLGSIILLGGLGYAIDQWQGTAPWGLVGGLMLGVTAGFYQLARVVFRRR
jgi:F0F1-type ATP synthase assembly protein I